MNVVGVELGNCHFINITHSHVSRCSKYEWVLKSVRDSLKKKNGTLSLKISPKKSTKCYKRKQFSFQACPSMTSTSHQAGHPRCEASGTTCFHAQSTHCLLHNSTRESESPELQTVFHEQWHGLRGREGRGLPPLKHWKPGSWTQSVLLWIWTP